jgi:transposase
VRPGFRGVGLLECHAAVQIRRTAWDEGATRGSFAKGFLTWSLQAQSVGDIARDLGISDQTVYSWRRQERIDQGLEAGLTSGERAELVAARRRIRELEAELAIHRKAAELLKGTTSPKAGSRPSR